MFVHVGEVPSRRPQFHSEGRLGKVLRGLSAAGIAHRSSQEVVALLILGDRSVEEEGSEGQHLTAHERGHQPAARATGRLRLLDLAAQLQQRAQLRLRARG